MLKIIEAIGKRSAYYALLNERADARARLVEICGYGDFLVRQIAANPLLLDELIDERLFETLPDRAELMQELDLEVDPLQEEDPERQVEALRHFQQAAVFRVAVADLSGRLPLMRVSDRLTDIAELIIQRAVDLSLRQICAQWGVPMCGDGPQRRPVAICVVGYGKLGRPGTRLRLGPGSGLPARLRRASGRKPKRRRGGQSIDNQVFFVRLAQRILHLLTMHSAAGRLYEVDVRLRPSGKGGLLVTSLAAFAEYQKREAWTWEHQALLHARAVAGDAELRARFEAVRIEVLRHNVRREGLRARSAADARAHAPRAVPQRAGASSISSRMPAASPTSNSWRSTGRWPGRCAIRRWSCSPTPSASWNRWPRPIWCRRPRGHADGGLSRLSGAHPPHVARRGCERGAGGPVRGRARRGDRRSGSRPWWTEGTAVRV